MESSSPPAGSATELESLRQAAEALAAKVDTQAETIRAMKAWRDLARIQRQALSTELGRARRGPRAGLDPPELEAGLEAPWELASRAAHLRAQARAGALDHGPAQASAPAGGQRGGALASAWPPLSPPEGADPAPLRVAEVGLGVSTFAEIGDPRTIVRPVNAFQASEVDVLVFVRANRDNVAELAAGLSEAFWTARRERPLKLVFDACMEGYAHVPERSAGLLALLRDKAIDPADAIYLTQDRGYRAAHEAFCAARGQRAMQVWVHDRYWGRTLEPLEIGGPGAFADRLAGFLKRPARRSRRFVSLNRTPRPVKMLYLSRLLRDGLWDQGWVSFGGLSDDRQVNRTRQAMVDGMLAMTDFADEAAQAIDRLGELEARSAGLFGIDESRSAARQLEQPIFAEDLPQYDDSWFTVITETEMSDRVHRITEKALKPLLNFHPFLMLASPGSLGLLRGYGFETFAGVFDESYDEEPDRRRRFDMVYGQLQRLCHLPEDELARMTAALREVLAFNACWGLTELPRLFRRRIGARLVDGLAPARGTSASG